MLLLKDYKFMQLEHANLCPHIYSHGVSETDDSVVDLTVKQSLISWLESRFNNLTKEEMECTIKKYVVNFKVSKKDIIDLISLPDIDKDLVENVKLGFDGKNFLDKLRVIDALLKGIKVLDMACGGGKFLVCMLDLVAKTRYNINLLLGNTVSLFAIKKDMLNNCIYGVDIDKTAVDVTRLALTLDVLGEIKTDGLNDHAILCNHSDFVEVDYNIVNTNSLMVDDYASYFKLETMFYNVFNKNKGFDIVLGNPTCQNVSEYKVYFDKRGFKGYQYGVSTSCLFIERALNIINKSGVVALVSSDKWLSNSYSDNIRQYIKLKAKVLGNVAFEGVRVMTGIDICVTFLTRNNDKLLEDYTLWHHSWENKIG